jgi:nicotinamide-nucleotide amidase
MQEMFVHQALPYLATHCPVAALPHTLELSLCQIKETDIDPLLRQLQQEHPDASIGIYPTLGVVKLRFRVKQRPERLAAWQQLIQDRFRTHLFEAPTLQEALVQILICKSKTLALAESCTGGALSARIVEVPDASKMLAGSLVVYCDEWKESMLGVSHRTLRDHGAVSRETAREMVEGLFERTDADVALSVTGIAGPTGSSTEKPIGTVWFALGERGGPVQTKHILAAPPRANIIDSAVQTALGALFRRLAYGVDL